MKKKSLVAGLAFTAILLLVPVLEPVRGSSAQEEEEKGLPELIQEFSLSETVYPQEAGETQLTLGAWRRRLDGSREWQASLKAEYGITSRFQVEMELPYLALRPEGEARRRGFGDVGVGVLYNFLPGNQPFALSAALEVALPTGNEDKDLGEGKATWEPSIIIAKQLGKGQVHLNLGAEIGGGEAEYFYNVAAVYPLGQRLYPTLELNGTRSQDEGSRLHVTPGVVYRVSQNAELGLGWPLGIRARSEKYGPIAKFTVEF